jgi:hypothetical protein
MMEHEKDAVPPPASPVPPPPPLLPLEQAHASTARVITIDALFFMLARPCMRRMLAHAPASRQPRKAAYWQ